MRRRGRAVTAVRATARAMDPVHPDPDARPRAGDEPPSSDGVARTSGQRTRSRRPPPPSDARAPSEGMPSREIEPPLQTHIPGLEGSDATSPQGEAEPSPAPRKRATRRPRPSAPPAEGEPSSAPPPAPSEGPAPRKRARTGATSGAVAPSDAGPDAPSESAPPAASRRSARSPAAASVGEATVKVPAAPPLPRETRAHDAQLPPPLEPPRGEREALEHRPPPVDAPPRVERDAREPRGGSDARGPRDAREPRGVGDARGPRDAREPRGERDARGPRDAREPRGERDARGPREDREHRDARPHGERREFGERPRREHGAPGDRPRRDERAPRDDEPSAERGPRPTVHRRAFPAEHLDEDALKVLRRLHREGHEAYLVGGCVRDLLLGKKPKDFDVTTSARPHEVKAAFRNCRIIGRRFRLAHILFGGGKVIETATFRRDPTAAGDEDAFLADTQEARAALDAGDFASRASAGKPRDEDADLLIRNDNVWGDPHEDALRRDFTINGLFYDVERGEVIDYVGGLHDVERRAINTIGLPDVRFREDPVRILRAIKFSARLDLGIDPEVYDAMVAQREELRKAARPRLFEEILRLLRGGAAHRSIWLAWELGVLSVVLPELAVSLDDDAARSFSVWGRLDAIDASVKAGRPPADAVLMAALLLGPIEEAIDGASDPADAYEDFLRDVGESLEIPRRMKDQMRAIIGSQRRLRGGRGASLVRRPFYADAVQLYELCSGGRPARVPPPAPSSDEFEGGALSAARRRRRRRPRE